MGAHQALRALHTSGYTAAAAFLWDLEQPLRPLRKWPVGALSVEGFPRAALAIGARDTIGPTALDEALLTAGEIAGQAFGAAYYLVREAGLVVVGEVAVVRAAVGPGAGSIEAQVAALKTLRGRHPPDGIARLLPRILGRGKAGLVEWAVERRLPGLVPTYPLSNSILRDCLEFLTALYASGRTEDAQPLQVGALAAVCHPDVGARIRRLGHALNGRLRDLPRGFAHGDFWGGNLLVNGQGLSGVIDWDYAGMGRMPLLDLLHLIVSAQAPSPPELWGPAVVHRLLPQARAGGDALVREYCARVGLKVTPELLVDLVLAYWLDRLAFELGAYADRRQRHRWVANNVDLVLDAVNAR
ncbi:MAG: aminoglycoside phosphotransferase family protein [Gaiellaceae bacterium]